MLTFLIKLSCHYWHLVVQYRCETCQARSLCYRLATASYGCDGGWACGAQTVSLQKCQSQEKERMRGLREEKKREGEQVRGYGQRGRTKEGRGENTFLFTSILQPPSTFVVWLFPLNCPSEAVLHAMWTLSIKTYVKSIFNSCWGFIMSTEHTQTRVMFFTETKDFYTFFNIQISIKVLYLNHGCLGD